MRRSGKRYRYGHLLRVSHSDAGVKDMDAPSSERSKYFQKSEQARLVVRELQVTNRSLAACLVLVARLVVFLRELDETCCRIEIVQKD